jgi:hypothetical protein
MRNVVTLAVTLAAALLLATPALGASEHLAGSGNDVALTAATPAPSAGDPRCERLRQKLKLQKRGVARATNARKRAFIRRNIGITKRRLANDGCAA